MRRREEFEPIIGADRGFGAAELARYDQLKVDPVMSALRAETIAHCEELGFARFVAWVLWPSPGVKVRRSTYVDNYSPDWMRRRLRNNYNSHDLVAARAAQTGRPFYWRDLETRHLTKSQARVMEEARTFGLRTGAALTRKDNAAGHICLCVSTITTERDFAKLFEARRPQLETLMAKISKQFRVFQDRDVAQTAGLILTPHECEALMYAARGLTTNRTATLMEISEYTVKDHVKSAMTKLRAKNKTEAVAKALVAGLIQP